MKLVSFSILTASSVIFAGLTLAETELYQTWDKKLADQKLIQQKVVYFQQMNVVTEHLLERLAVDSQHDPALAELLKRNKIGIKVNAPQPTDVNQTVPSVPDTSATPAATDKNINAPINPATSHP